MADTSIYSNIRPFQLEDPLTQAAKAQQVVSGNLAIQDAQRKFQLDDDISSALADSKGDLSKASDLLAERGRGQAALQLRGQAVKLQSEQLQQKKLEGDIAHQDMETTKTAAALHREQLAGVNDPQSAAQWVQAGYADPRLGPILSRGGTVEQALARIPQDPAQFQEWKARNGMGIEKFLETQNANAQHAANRAVTAAGQTETARHNAATEANAAANLAENRAHHRAIEGDPTTIEQTAQAIAKGDLQPLTGFALARPMGQQIMARVTQINPQFDPTAFATRQRTENAFATGQEGRAVKSFSVAISHLGTLDQLADALKNGDMRLVNRLGNAISTATGGPAPNNFESAKKIVGDEIVKAIVGSGGGVADREEAAKTISAANSPEQLKGVISTYKELMKGQLDGLRRQYQAGGGRKDFDKEFLSEEARAVAHGGGGVPERPAGKTNAQIMAEARAAVAGGVPKDQVNARLKGWGLPGI